MCSWHRFAPLPKHYSSTLSDLIKSLLQLDPNKRPPIAKVLSYFKGQESSSHAAADGGGGGGGGGAAGGDSASDQAPGAAPTSLAVGAARGDHVIGGLVRDDVRLGATPPRGIGAPNSESRRRDQGVAMAMGDPAAFFFMTTQRIAC